jgi:hypothetical protein
VMSTEQRTARAIQRASEQKARVRALRGRPGFYQVRSASDPAERYVVTASYGVITCSCKAASYGNDCWHAEKLRSRLIRENGGTPQQLQVVA